MGQNMGCKSSAKLARASRKFAAAMSVDIRNRKASFTYFLGDEYTAGIQLLGCEVKSIRHGKASISEGYCKFHQGELYIFNMHIDPYANAGHIDPIARRQRKLLLKRTELNKLQRKLRDVGVTLVPLHLFIADSGYAKLKIAIAKGKKMHDKRHTIKDRDQQRDLDRRRS